VESVQAKADAVCWLMREQPAELVFTVFGETHVAGHYCWSDELAGDSGRAGSSPMFTVYEALDRAIAQIHREAGEGATVIVISGDSVGPNNAGWHLLPDVLARLGYLATPQATAEGDAAPAAAPKFDPVKALRDMLPKDFRQRIARMLPTGLRDKLAQRVDTADIDWSRTRAYLLPTDLEGYVRINLRGREPQGIVEPGADFERLLAELTTDLLALRDAQTGRPIVRDVIRASAEFPGARGAYLPDLVVRWDAAAPITSASSPKIGTVASPSPDSRPGTHRGPGFVLARGPGIAPGSTLCDGHIVDFAPTLLTRMGVAAPAQMRGRVWPELAAR
jgi:predicted AlkP superfamily phosphohydrolase/phosphomutase